MLNLSTLCMPSLIIVRNFSMTFEYKRSHVPIYVTSTVTMLRALVLACVLVTVQGRTYLGAPRTSRFKSRYGNRIIGGSDDTIENNPWQVQLTLTTDDGDYFCGGSIISENYILTAAHCTEGATAIQVRSGSSKMDRGGVVTNAESYAQNPKYDPDTTDYDVAVIKLAKPIQFDDTQKVIPLRTKEAEAGETVLITGWGDLDLNGNQPTSLKAVTVPAVDRETCNTEYGGEITERMACAGEVGKGSCYGDSGGPNSINGELVGIVSWANECALDGYPDVFTNLGNEEIKQYIDVNSNNEATWV